MAGDEADRLREITMGEGDANRRRQRIGGRNSRHHRHRHAGSFERRNLLAGATEDHRIAGLQADHMLALPGELQHQIIDVGLRTRGTARALADHHALGLATGELQHIFGHQIVEQDDVRRLQRAHGLEREKLRIARPGAHQRHATLLDVACTHLFHQAFEGAAICRSGGAAERSVGEALPESATRRAFFQPGHHCAANVARPACPSRKCSR